MKVQPVKLLILLSLLLPLSACQSREPHSERSNMNNEQVEQEIFTYNGDTYTFDYTKDIEIIPPLTSDQSSTIISKDNLGAWIEIYPLGEEPEIPNESSPNDQIALQEVKTLNTVSVWIYYALDKPETIEQLQLVLDTLKD